MDVGPALLIDLTLIGVHHLRHHGLAVKADLHRRPCAAQTVCFDRRRWRTVRHIQRLQLSTERARCSGTPGSINVRSNDVGRRMRVPELRILSAEHVVEPLGDLVVRVGVLDQGAPRHRPSRARRRGCAPQPSVSEFLGETARNGCIGARRQAREPWSRSIYGSPRTVRWLAAFT